MVEKLKIAQDWLPRYTGSQIDELGDYILLTNFKNYVNAFAERFNCEIKGEGGAMQSATNSDGLSIINFGIGSPNAALIMDLLSAKNPKSVLFSCLSDAVPQHPRTHETHSTFLCIPAIGRRGFGGGHPLL